MLIKHPSFELRRNNIMIVKVSPMIKVNGMNENFSRLLKEYFNTKIFQELNRTGNWALEVANPSGYKSALEQLSINPKNIIMRAEYLGDDDKSHPDLFKIRLDERSRLLNMNDLFGCDFVTNSIRFAFPIVRRNEESKEYDKLIFVRLVADLEIIRNDKADSESPNGTNEETTVSSN